MSASTKKFRRKQRIYPFHILRCYSFSYFSREALEYNFFPYFKPFDTTFEICAHERNDCSRGHRQWWYITFSISVECATPSHNLLYIYISLICWSFDRIVSSCVCSLIVLLYVAYGFFPFLNVFMFTFSFSPV